MASIHKRAVGIFASRTKTASALRALKDSGFSMSYVSVIAKDANQQANIAGVTVKDEATNQADTAGTVGAATGGVLGGVAGLLAGLGALTIPGLGPVLLAGEAAVVLATLVGGVAGAAAGGLLGALVGLGMPEHRAARYQDRVARGDYLVMVKGTDDAIARAEQILGSAGIEDWGVYAADPAPRREPQTQSFSDRSHGVAEQTVDNRYHSDHRDRRQPGDHRDWRAEPVAQQSALVADVQRDRDLRQTRDRYQVATLPYASSLLTTGGSAGGDRPPTPDHSTECRVVGVFLQQQQMEEALAQLQQTGFAMHKFSIAVREANAPSPEQQAFGGHSLAGATQLMAGLNRVMLPEIGTLLVMGPDAKAISSTFVPQPSGRGGTPQGLGIAPESAHLYRRYLIDGAYLVTLRGHNQDVLHAAATLGKWGMHDWDIYDVWQR